MKKVIWALALWACAGASQAATLILLNGRVFLPQPNQFAQAIAITGGVITAVGSNQEIANLASASTKTIDLRGHLVIPGFNDAHVHFGTLPSPFILNTNPDNTFAEVKQAIQFALDETGADTFFFGTIGPPVFFDSNATRAALDAVAPGRKIMLTEFTGHGAILSTAALAALGAANPTDPIGGKFERDLHGQLTGRVFEYAQYNLERTLADSTLDADDVAALQQLSDQALRFGITTLQVMPNMNSPRFDAIVAQAHPKVRVRHLRMPMTTATDLNVADGRGRVVRPVKWILDGTPIERGAALRTNYTGTAVSGVENFTPQQLRTMLADAIAHDEQPLLHAGGDRTIVTIFKVMLALDRTDWPARRLRLEHGDGLQSDLILGARQLGVVVVQNPTHLPFRNFYPAGDYMLLRTLVAKGVKLAFGSDGPLDPFLNLQLAVTHPVVPDEKLTLFQALTAYTAGSAFAEQLDDKGQIAPGQVADLAVLSQDLFARTPDQYVGTESILTIVGGKIAFDAGVLP